MLRTTIMSDLESLVISAYGAFSAFEKKLTKPDLAPDPHDLICSNKDDKDSKCILKPANLTRNFTYTIPKTSNFDIIGAKINDTLNTVIDCIYPCEKIWFDNKQKSIVTVKLENTQILAKQIIFDLGSNTTMSF